MRLLRQYLQESSYQFEELLSNALRAPSEVATSILAQSNIPDTDYLALVSRVEEASADLVGISAEIGYFGKDEHYESLLATIEQLAGMNEVRNGFTHLNQLRVYPAVLAFYAAGIASLAKGNLTLLAKLHAIRVKDPARMRSPALGILSPGYALDGPLQVPRTDGQVLKTPQNDRVLDAVKPALIRLPRVSEARCEELFSRFEYLNALAATLVADVYPHYGRFLWHDGDTRGATLAETTDAELNEQGAAWPPFKAGLFGADLDAFKAAKAALDKEVRQHRWRYR